LVYKIDTIFDFIKIIPKKNIMKLKNYFFLAIFSVLTFFVQAQNATGNSSLVEINVASDFFVTQPMRDYPQFNPMDLPEKEFAKGGRMSSSRQKKADYLKLAGESPTQVDPLIQKDGYTRAGSPPIQNFPGITSNASPPDPSAAVGPNHIVQMVNTGWTVFDKEGVEAPGFPKSLSDPLGSTVSDPIVLYDREADRWLISMGSSAGFKVAISETNDPTGSYYVYAFSVGGFQDFPKYGIYGNSYLITGNFSSNGRFYAINREKMITGDPTAEIINLNLPNYTGGTTFQSPQVAHSEGAGIAAGAVPIVWFQDDAWGGISTDHLKVWNFDVDWSDPSSATISDPLEIELAPFDSLMAGQGGDPWANIAQPVTPQRLDALLHTINYQTHRYDFGTHESMVLNFVVETENGSRISGLRWVELRKTTGDWELYQEGTFVDPTGDESVFLGGIGMDQEGNIGFAYTKSGIDTFPSLFYTGRLDENTLGEMTIVEELIAEGVSPVTSNSRYGDYAQLTRDPVDDLTFWYTGEYSGQINGRKSQIASFKISGSILGVDELDLNSSELVITSSNQENFDITLFNESTSDILRLAVYDITGKRVVYDQVRKENNQYYKHALDMSNVSSGVYIVELGNSKTKINKKIIVR